jgi:hypothetical protein
MKRIILIITIFTSILFGSNISTYLTSDLQTQTQVENGLKKAGFEILASYDAMQDSDYKVIIYTSKDLKQLSSKENRGFVAVQKVLISENDSQLVFTNPLYYLKAMLQDDYDSSLVSKINSALNSAFTLENGTYNLDKDDLASYHFMFGMPYYEDMIEVATGDDLEAKLNQNAKDNIVFKIKVANGFLYGIAMNGTISENSYMTTLNQKASSAFLPYTVLIQNNTAKILAPKYYLALSLPQLTMGEFMTISDIPAVIEEHFISLFK